MSLDNPAVFPNTGNSTWGLAPEIGMRLRDHFAGQALSTLTYAPHDHTRESQAYAAIRIANLAYEIADAMLAARGES